MGSVLVTGGTGYIGSHTVVELLEFGYDVVVVDNLARSDENVLEKIYIITGRKPKFYNVDILDRDGLNQVFKRECIDGVIHFAGLKEAVSESPNKPIDYYYNNVVGTLNLIDVMRKYNCKNIVYSSSGIVYGKPMINPITEECPKGKCPNPYAWSKSMVEQVLQDMYFSDDDWNVVVLRYFNPIGAHKSGLIGDRTKGTPSHLLPYVMQVALGIRPWLCVWGDDYDTPDGTGVRDYIHVVDLAKGHIKAYEKLKEKCGYRVFNLGTGVGYSVLEIIKIFEKITEKEIPYKIMARRPGDIASCYADTTLAKSELGWTPELDIYQMCRDSWNWQSNSVE